MASPEYATVTQLGHHVDARTLAELASDNDADGTVSDANAVLMAAIRRASSDVESHALRGGRYSSTDLATACTDGDATLIGLTCDLAIAQIFARRAGVLPDVVKERFDAAKRTLGDLRDGRQVFAKVGSAASAAAGTGDLTVISEAARGRMALASDSPFYPVRPTIES